MAVYFIFIWAFTIFGSIFSSSLTNVTNILYNLLKSINYYSEHTFPFFHGRIKWLAKRKNSRELSNQGEKIGEKNPSSSHCFWSDEKKNVIFLFYFSHSHLLDTCAFEIAFVYDRTWLPGVILLHSIHITWYYSPTFIRILLFEILDKTQGYPFACNFCITNFKCIALCMCVCVCVSALKCSVCKLFFSSITFYSKCKLRAKTHCRIARIEDVRKCHSGDLSN